MAGDVQYGGRITDNIDRRLFSAYTEAWLSSNTLTPSFSFNPEHPINRIPGNFSYKTPNFIDMEEYMNFIQKIPEVDSPEVLGLHPNADLTFRFKEVTQLLDTIIETQPKQSGAAAGGQTREDVVFGKCQELTGTMPVDYIEDEYEERITSLGGFDVPLNIFLYQEVQRQQMVIEKVRQTLEIAMQAIRGEVVVTAEIMDSINAIFDARVPKSWLYSPAGDELSWLAPNLGIWFGGLLLRDTQYRNWLGHGRPHTYWLAGFFNPQGFLTAVQQEITRAHKNENWALDSVVLHSEVTDISNSDHVKHAPKEGVYIHGLYMDGAAWSNGSIIESEPKKLFSLLPVMIVTAITKAAKKAVSSGGDYGPFGGYECPIYKYPQRTDRYLIFTAMLPTQDMKPLHWTLRGVALLCATA
jgi:dynein heavy chain